MALGYMKLLWLFLLFQEICCEVNLSVRKNRRLNKPSGYREYSFTRREGDGVYYADIAIGVPPQKFTAIVDTGSSTIAVPCDGCDCGDHNQYKISTSTTAKMTDKTYRQCYSEGSCNEGKIINDYVCIGEECAIEEGVSHGFGCCNRFARAFKAQEADGIIGFSGGPNTLIADLREHHKLEYDIFSLCLGIQGGGVSLGGGMAEKHMEPMKYVPLIKGNYYGVRLSSVAVGNNIHTTAGINPIIDSGTTFTYAPREIVSAVSSSISSYCDTNTCLGSKNPTNAPNVDKSDSAGCFAKPSEMTFAHFAASYPSIEFNLEGETSICWPPLGYFYEAKQDIYCIGMLKQPRGSKKMVIGANLMSGFDVTFDHEKNRIGFARSICDEPEDVGVDKNNMTDLAGMQQFYLQNSCCGSCYEFNKVFIEEEREKARAREQGASASSNEFVAPTPYIDGDSEFKAPSPDSGFVSPTPYNEKETAFKAPSPEGSFVSPVPYEAEDTSTFRAPAPDNSIADTSTPTTGSPTPYGSTSTIANKFGLQSLQPLQTDIWIVASIGFVSGFLCLCVTCYCRNLRKRSKYEQLN